MTNEEAAEILDKHGCAGRPMSDVMQANKMGAAALRRVAELDERVKELTELLEIEREHQTNRAPF